MYLPPPKQHTHTPPLCGQNNGQMPVKQECIPVECVLTVAVAISWREGCLPRHALGKHPLGRPPPIPPRQTLPRHTSSSTQYSPWADRRLQGADPGWAPNVRGGGRGGANIRICQFFQKKLHEIEKISGHRGTRASPPPPPFQIRQWPVELWSITFPVTRSVNIVTLFPATTLNRR